MSRTEIAGVSYAGHCLILGILNVTPDSFSDGGHYVEHSAAIERGLQLAATGADIIDVGGESTRPGAQRVPEHEERDRVLPVIQALTSAGLQVSIDTSRASVAQAAINAGACMVNDVSGGLADPGMASVVAGAGVSFVAMHWRGPSATMQRAARYDDVVTEVVTELAQRLDALTRAGLSEDRILLDPGLGFAKTAAHDWALLANLDQLHTLGRPVLVGASRKSFLRSALAGTPGLGGRMPTERDLATAVVSVLAFQTGAAAVRVHEPTATTQAFAVLQAWRRPGDLGDVTTTLAGSHPPSSTGHG